jgi:ferredoxin-NADP reductase
VGGPTLVLATDTGLAAALGLMASTAFADYRPKTTFVWLRESPDYFVADDVVLRWLETCRPGELPGASLPSGSLPTDDRVGSSRPLHVEIAPVPPHTHPERLAMVRAALPSIEELRRFDQAFLCGDGNVNYALLNELSALGVAVERDSVESFFNMPKKST